jgi:hypothetical protein
MKNAPTPLSVQNTQAVSGPRLGLMGPPASNVPLSGQQLAVQQPQFQEVGQSTAQQGGGGGGSGLGFSGFANNSANQQTAPQDLSPAN